MKRTWRWPLAGFVVGGLIGATFLTVNVVGASGPEQRRAVNHSFGEILHTPPLILKQNEPVELTFGVVCGLSEDRPEARCSPKGLVYLRASGTGEFRALRLAREPNGQLSAEVPSRYTGGAGFDYYVEIEDGRGYSATLPQGAAEAPQHAWIASNWTTVALGSPRFGEARRPDSIVVRASWGKGDRALGLDSGREQSRIEPGPAARSSTHTRPRCGFPPGGVGLRSFPRDRSRSLVPGGPSRATWRWSCAHRPAKLASPSSAVTGSSRRGS